MLNTILEDIRAVKRNDPAAHGWLEVLLCHVPLHAIIGYRLAHWLHERAGLRLPARLLSVLVRFWTGVEIHPGARIGTGFFLDHGAGVVIGETAVIGDYCVMFHNVTLGGTGKYRGRRHPSVGDHVFIGTNAILLGPIRVGDHAKVGANAFVINHDVPPFSTVVGTPARIVKRNGERTDEELPRMSPPPGAEPVELEV
ncbi:MAG TPA: serine O-acetyltransferase EpsC [Methylomirabilota bacterium]|nr:serine O-acetyltransferase EpsC [Methylomirabilota bacterium]